MRPTASAVFGLALALAVLPTPAKAGYQVLWSVSTHNDAPTDITYGQVPHEPISGDIDGDGASEIIGLSLDATLLKIVDSNSGYVELSLPSPTGSWLEPSLFDVDGDGRPEVLAVALSGQPMQLVAIGFVGVAGVSAEYPGTPVSVLSVSPSPSGGPIAFGLGIRQRSHVSIRMFDLAGRLVKVAADEMRDPGSAIVTWDGTAADGARVSSGVYFYRVEADGAVVKADKVIITH